MEIEDQADKKRTQFYMDPELHRRLRMAAAVSEESQGKIMRRALERELDRMEKEEKKGG